MKKNILLLLIILFGSSSIILERPFYATAEGEQLKEAIKNESAEISAFEEDLSTISASIEERKTSIVILRKEIKKSEAEIVESEKIIKKLVSDSESILNILQKYANTKNILLQLYAMNDIKQIGKINSYNLVTNTLLEKLQKLQNKKAELETVQKGLKKAQSKNKYDLKELEKEKVSIVVKKEEEQQKINSLHKKLAKLEKSESVIMGYYNQSAKISQAKQEQLMRAVGIPQRDFKFVDYIITVESSWNYTATNPYSQAYGLCQALPGEKLASAGSGWRNNPETQLKWCSSYAKGRYGSWKNAYQFHKNNSWW